MIQNIALPRKLAGRAVVRSPGSGMMGWMAAAESVILYDGTCGLCHRSVQWILRHERDHELCFAPLQGATAAALRVRFPEIPATLESVVLVADGRARLRSKAFLYS